MLFIVSKLVGFLTSPANLMMLGFIAAYFLTRRKGYGLAALTLVAMFHSPLANWMIYPLETRFERVQLPDHVDGILVLGGAIDSEISAKRGIVELEASSDRVLAFLELANRYPEAKLVYAGGSAAILGRSNAEAGLIAGMFDNLGLPRDRLILESRSRNTYENILYSKEIAEPQKTETWVIVTSAFHMPRSIGIARKLDWNFLPYPVDYATGDISALRDFTGLAQSNFRTLEVASKEWVGLVSYFLLGRTSALFPKP